MQYRGIGWRAPVLRQRANLSQAGAAKKAGIGLKTWQNMEQATHAKREPASRSPMRSVAGTYG